MTEVELRCWLPDARETGPPTRERGPRRGRVAAGRSWRVVLRDGSRRDDRTGRPERSTRTGDHPGPAHHLWVIVRPVSSGRFVSPRIGWQALTVSPLPGKCPF